MRHFFALLALATLGGGPAAAEPVPLPRPRPAIWSEPHTFAEAVAGLDFNAAEVSAVPTACDGRLAAMAEIRPLPWLIGPGACGGHDMVEIKAVLLPDKRRIAITPASVLRCSMAEQLAAWVRDAAAPDVKKSGAQLRGIDTYDDFECRSRNRRPGAKLSEHGKGNAVDVRALTLSDGRVIRLTDITVDRHLRDDLRDAACRRFTTVLGPGADPYHADHVHLDIRARHNGYRICQWDVRVPAPKAGGVVQVPLPRPRPAIGSRHAR